MYIDGASTIDIDHGGRGGAEWGEGESAPRIETKDLSSYTYTRTRLLSLAINIVSRNANQKLRNL